MRYYYKPIRIAKIKNNDNIKCSKGGGENRSIMSWWWDYVPLKNGLTVYYKAKHVVTI